MLVVLERQYPSYETNLSIWTEIQNQAMLLNNPKAARIFKLRAKIDHWVGQLTPGSYCSDELPFWLGDKIQQDGWDERRATAERKATILTYEDLSVRLLQLALEKESHPHFNPYRPGGSNCGNYSCGYQGLGPGQGTYSLRMRAT